MRAITSACTVDAEDRSELRGDAATFKLNSKLMITSSAASLFRVHLRNMAGDVTLLCVTEDSTAGNVERMLHRAKSIDRWHARALD